MLKAENIFKTYRPKSGIKVEALRGVSLSFKDSGMVFICGKSGSGKSTLINILSGMDKADSGTVTIADRTTDQFSQSDFDNYRNSYVGYIFQDFGIIDQLNVEQNIALAVQMQGQKVSKQQVDSVLSQVGLEGYGNRKTNELSGGQKQRISIARALIKDPKILFADEPTGN
ncbi:MAG: ATP-binding cassette domain-containing protein, partial [Firmicutes bacterium]|nr:ATP-binding cassette domain-containing protein [Bacillota bacterium]